MILIPLFISTITAQIYYNGVAFSKSGNNYYGQCDWKNPYYSTQGLVQSDCEAACLADSQCSHYSWAAGFCYFRTGLVGDDAILSHNFCGIIIPSSSGCTASDTALNCPGSIKPQPPAPKPTNPPDTGGGSQSPPPSNGGSSGGSGQSGNGGSNNQGGQNNGQTTNVNKPATQVQNPSTTRPGNAAPSNVVNNPQASINSDNVPTAMLQGPTPTSSSSPVQSSDSNNSNSPPSQTTTFLIYIGIAAGCVIVIGTISVFFISRSINRKDKTLVASSILSEKGKDLENNYYSSDISSRTTSAFASERGTLSAPSERENEFRVFHFSTDSKLRSVTGSALQEQFNNIQPAGLSNISISPTTNLWKGHYDNIYLLANENGTRLFLDLVRYFIFPVNMKFTASFELLEDEYLVVEELDEILIKQHYFNGTFEATNISANETGLLPISCLPYPKFAPKLILVHLPEFAHENIPDLEIVEAAKKLYPDKVETRSVRNYMSIEGGKIHDAGIFDSVLDNSKVILCGTTVMVQYMHEKLIDLSSEFWTYMDSSVVTEEYDIFADRYEDYAPYEEETF
ncbi:hypothetical protein HDV06_006551 [Boothiomyces sp. JEL0866]|nr:hypothetical protein HDV06_006551 [Boothiomyces sp. JEL0866]